MRRSLFLLCLILSLLVVGSSQALILIGGGGPANWYDDWGRKVVITLDRDGGSAMSPFCSSCTGDGSCDVVCEDLTGGADCAYWDVTSSDGNSTLTVVAQSGIPGCYDEGSYMLRAFTDPTVSSEENNYITHDMASAPAFNSMEIWVEVDDASKLDNGDRVSVGGFYRDDNDDLCQIAINCATGGTKANCDSGAGSLQLRMSYDTTGGSHSLGTTVQEIDEDTWYRVGLTHSYVAGGTNNDWCTWYFDPAPFGSWGAAQETKNTMDSAAAWPYLGSRKEVSTIGTDDDVTINVDMACFDDDTLDTTGCATTTTDLCSSGTLAYYPVLLSEVSIPAEAIDTDDPNYSSNHAQTDCLDFRAYAGDYSASNPATEDTNRLALEIVRCTHGSSPIVQVWAEVPSVNCIDQGSDTKITLYYNATSKTQPSAGSAYGKYDVWNGTTGTGDDYAAVYHMEEASGTLTDSTSYQNTLSCSNCPDYQQTGKIGYGMTFTRASSEYFYSGSFDDVSNAPFSIEAWGYVASKPGAGNCGTVLSIADYSADLWGADNMCDNGNDVHYSSFRGASSFGEDEQVEQWNATTWYFWSGSYTSTSARTAYQQAVPGPGDSTVCGNLSGIDTISVGGRRYNSTIEDYMFGTLDEVRLSKEVARSEDWWLATYQIGNAPNTYVVEGSPGSP